MHTVFPSAADTTTVLALLLWRFLMVAGLFVLPMLAKFLVVRGNF